MSAHKITAHNKLPTVRKLMLLHGVNNAMAVKYPVLLNDFRPDPELVLLSKRTVENLMKYHGTAAGVFTSDETLDGTNPSKGVELCTVVEFMRSLETLVEKRATLITPTCWNLIVSTRFPQRLPKIIRRISTSSSQTPLRQTVGNATF